MLLCTCSSPWFWCTCSPVSVVLFTVTFTTRLFINISSSVKCHSTTLWMLFCNLAAAIVTVNTLLLKWYGGSFCFLRPFPFDCELTETEPGLTYFCIPGSQWIFTGWVQSSDTMHTVWVPVLLPYICVSVYFLIFWSEIVIWDSRGESWFSVRDCV